ncbi:hypothetical protein ACFFX0_27895 [Citricoccus parietis]|uniref:Uncharacterized protein n=1 Tax=Citricoccus parietis TaxID=592307 RepID=A0ABV5G7A5_9MICC
MRCWLAASRCSRCCPMPTTCRVMASRMPSASTTSSAGIDGRGRKVAPAAWPYSDALKDKTWPRNTLRSTMRVLNAARNESTVRGEPAITSTWASGRPCCGEADRCSSAIGSPSWCNRRTP